MSGGAEEGESSSSHLGFAQAAAPSPLLRASGQDPPNSSLSIPPPQGGNTLFPPLDSAHCSQDPASPEAENNFHYIKVCSFTTKAICSHYKKNT